MVKFHTDLITGLFIVFVILIFGQGVIGDEKIFTWLFLIIAAILIIYTIIQLIKTPNRELIENFKKNHIITQILIVITIVAVICDLILNPMKWTFSSIPILLLILAIFCEWFFKKED